MVILNTILSIVYRPYVISNCIFDAGNNRIAKPYALDRGTVSKVYDAQWPGDSEERYKILGSNVSSCYIAP